MMRTSAAALLTVVTVVAATGCGGSTPRAAVPTGYNGGDAQASQADDSTMLTIAAGPYVAGSTPEEREQAYADYRATSGHDAALRGSWFDREEARRPAHLATYRIDLSPVTNAAYAEFVRDTDAPAPFIDAAAWAAQRFSQNYERDVARLNWIDGHPPGGREDHPVVLVTWAQASAYCSWRGAVVGEARRLPTEAEYEKAARGGPGLIYPWSNDWDASKLNSQVAGPMDTVATGTFPAGASLFGMLDAAGNVFQWTQTPWPVGKDRMTVKGSAWDDYAGVGRGASRHGRRVSIKHAIVGFRCAADAK